MNGLHGENGLHVRLAVVVKELEKEPEIVLLLSRVVSRAHPQASPKVKPVIWGLVLVIYNLFRRISHVK